MRSNKPDLAHKVEDIKKECFRYLFRKHAVYFKVREDDIFIIRVYRVHTMYYAYYKHFKRLSAMSTLPVNTVRIQLKASPIKKS